MGIDPGMGTTGWGIIRSVKGNLKYLDSGRISTSPAQPSGERLAKLYNELQGVARLHNVVLCGVESGFVGRSAQSSLKLGQARAAAVLAAQTLMIPVRDVSPREVKLAVTGHGGASKEQVGYMVGKLLNLEFEPNESDISDALAIAICVALERQPVVVRRAGR